MLGILPRRLPARSLRVPSLRRPALVRTPAEPLPPDPGPVLVLSGGSRMGAVQVGILRALAATGFRPAALIGTSTGAFNAAYLAFHPEDERHEQLRAVWAGVRLHRVFNRSPMRIAYNALVRRDRFYSDAELRLLLAQHIQPDSFDAAALPLHVVATSLTTGEKRVFTSGSVHRAVLASAAIPGLFPPVAIDGDVFVDGAVTANLDLGTALDLGARHIVAIDVSASAVATQARSISAVLARTVEILMRDRTYAAFDQFGARARITLLRPGPLTMQRLTTLPIGEILDEADGIGAMLVERALDAQGRLAHGHFSNEPVPAIPGLAVAG